MDAGGTFAMTHQLRHGSKQKVLVPQLYAVPRAGDLSAGSALLSANVVNISTRGDTSNRHASILGVMSTCPQHLPTRFKHGF